MHPIHELGHSIIEVSEEYDGAYAYTGVNTSQDLSEPVPRGALAHPDRERLQRAAADRLRVDGAQCLGALVDNLQRIKDVRAAPRLLFAVGLAEGRGSES